MRNRLSLLFIAATTAVGLTATSFAAVVPNEGVSVGLPGVRGIEAMQVCTETAGRAICKRVATPNIKSGRISARWNRGLRTTVLATPTSPYPAQCNGRPGAAIDTSVLNVATDITLSVHASYAGVTAPRTVVSVRRTLRPDQDAAVWACLL